MNGWELPKTARLGKKTYALNVDFRDILEIFSYLNDPDLPQYLRWQIALALFYGEPVPEADFSQAAEYLSKFLSCPGPEGSPQGRPLIHWQQDAPLILADVNRVAGREIRQEKFIHWWTFLSWFHAVGQGQLSTVVAIRDKLSRGKKLERWEKDYYREYKAIVDLKKPLSQQELAEKLAIEKMLESGGNHGK